MERNFGARLAAERAARETAVSAICTRLERLEDLLVSSADGMQAYQNYPAHPRRPLAGALNHATEQLDKALQMATGSAPKLFTIDGESQTINLEVRLAEVVDAVRNIFAEIMVSTECEPIGATSCESPNPSPQELGPSLYYHNKAMGLTVVEDSKAPELLQQGSDDDVRCSDSLKDGPLIQAPELLQQGSNEDVRCSDSSKGSEGSSSRETELAPSNCNFEGSVNSMFHRATSLETHHADREALARLTQFHKLDSGVWDTVVLVGMYPFSLRESVVLVFAFAFNVIVQTSFISLIFFNFLQGVNDIYPSAAAVEKWRLTEAHDISQVSPWTGESLISRVCKLDPTVGNGQMMVEILHQIRSYTAPFWAFESGQILSTLVIAIWCGFILEEVQNCSSFVIGFSNLPRRDRTIWAKTNKGSPKYAFESVSTCRYIFVCCVAFVRFGIAVMLGIVGSVWLATTADLEDMVLNCVALYFITDLDELFFEMMVPEACHAMQRALVPLTKSSKLSQCHSRRELVALISTSCGVLIVIMSMIAFCISPLSHVMHVTEDVLCAGNTDYATGVNVGTSLIYYAKSHVVESDVAWPRGEPVGLPAMRGLAHDSCDQNEVVKLDTLASLKDRASLPVQFLVQQRFRRCEDTLARAPHFVLATIQRENVNSSGESCADLQGSCFGIGSNLLRLMCPVTCGATSPQSGLFLDYPAYGLSRPSCHDTTEYRRQLEAIPCSDPSPQELKSIPGWSSAWNLVVDFWGRFSANQMTNYRILAELFINEGCDGVVKMDKLDLSISHTSYDFCTDTEDLPNIALFCPVSCGCRQKSHAACPPACDNGTWIHSNQRLKRSQWIPLRENKNDRSFIYDF